MAWGGPHSPDRASSDQLDASSSTEIRLLGRLRATIGGVQVDEQLPGRRGRVLFALLALSRERPYSRDEVIEILWPDERPASPGGALRTLLTRLRQAVGDSVVQGGRALSLHLPDDAWIDVEAARRHASAAAVALHDGRPDVAQDEARAAWALASGPLLPEFGDAWIEDLRRELAELAATVLEVLARAALARPDGDASAARSAARRLIEREPFRESGYMLLMEAHALAGDVAEGLRVFERLRVLLRDELGATPSGAVVDLHGQLLVGSAHAKTGGGTSATDARSPTTGTGGSPLPPFLERIAGRPFVGRASELATLERLWGEAKRRHPTIVFLAGEPGIGKTTLAARVARQAHREGAMVLYGQCDEHSPVPYQPLVQALRQSARDPVGTSTGGAVFPQVAELGSLFPELRDRLPETSPPAIGEPNAERYRLFEAVRELFALAAADRPVLLVLDDLHWADRSTLLLVQHVVRESVSARLLVLATYREAELSRDHPLRELRLELAPDCPPERLALAGLRKEESAELIEVYLGGVPVDAVIERWHNRTDGHPLFLHELLRSTERTSIETPRELEPPRSVREVIMRRLRRLEAADASTLAAAAVIGRDFGLDVLASLVDRSGEAMLHGLEAAMAEGLVLELEEVDRFAFAHALVREALYAQHTRSRRIRLHARIAETLERDGARTPAAELAHHFFESRHVTGDERAVRYCSDAARAAIAAFAYEEAAAHYRRALQALEPAGPEREAERCDLLLALGDVEWRAGAASVGATFGRVVESSRARGDARQLALAALGVRSTTPGSRDDARILLLREALDALDPEDSRLRVQVLAGLADGLHFAADCDRALTLSAAGLETARRLADPDALAAGLIGRHATLLHIEHVDERVSLLREMVALAQQTGDPGLEAQGRQWSIYAAFEVGDFTAARTEYAEFSRLADTVRQPAHQHSALAWKAVLAQLDGRLEDAEALAHQGHALAEHIQSANAAVLFAAQMAFIRRDQGRLAELLPLIEEGATVEEGSSWRAGLTLALVAAGEHKRARDSLAVSAQKGLDDIPRDFWWLSTLALLAEGCGQLGEPTLAARVYRLLSPHAERHAQVVFAAHLGCVHRFLGLLADVLGERERAEFHLQAALERHIRCAAPALIVRSQCDLDLSLQTADPGDRARGRELVESARQAARGTGLEHLADETAGELDGSEARTSRI